MYQAELTQEGQAIINISIPRAELTIDKNSKLGEGSFGVVYKGKRGHIAVAVKELRLFGDMPETIIDEFKKEALIMLQLGVQCPNLVQLHGVCYEQPYSLVMELFTQGNLYSLLKNSQALTWSQKEKIAADVAIGLDFLHKHKILHRDIKSMNVLIKEDLTAKISDYGLATVKKDTMSSTTANSAVGTIPWMAPELFKKKPMYSEESDIYSYGLVLWEMATHRLPFSDCDSPGVLINEILNGDPESIPEATPPTFAKLINDCRDKDPKKRPTISLIINSLQNPQHMLLFSNLSITDTIPAPKTMPITPTPKAYIPSPRTKSQITQIFKHIGYGEQDLAETMLVDNPKLTLLHGDLTDCSQRTWQNITAYQYALLALDYHMWNMLHKYMDTKEIRAQLEELNSNATLNEEGWAIKATWTTKWPSIGWISLIKALDKYIEKYDGNIWYQQVGGAQLMLPAHVINEYSHPSRPFYPCPTWGDGETLLPRTGVSDWQEADNGIYNLGKDFAWCRANWGAREGWGGDYARYDRAAINELLRARVEQARILLETQLLFKPDSLPRLAM